MNGLAFILHHVTLTVQPALQTRVPLFIIMNVFRTTDQEIFKDLGKHFIVLTATKF